MLLDKIGPFAIEKELGSGAMGTVYLGTPMQHASVYGARHIESGQRVAIKVMAPGVGSSELALARFKREAEILKQLKHPHIVRIIGVGRHQKSPYYAMEYVEGESLDRVLARRGRMTWEEVVAIGRQLCDALRHAHEKGIIHRDLKPSNLMVLADGTVKLMDFGIAKDVDVTALTAANSTVGTAAYMSPEQCRGERELTPKSDLYSLGIMFYELLTGKKPFVADNTPTMFRLHCDGEFERPSRLSLDIPVWLDTLVCQLMEKRPEKRPYDAQTVLQSLERIAEKVTAQTSAGVEAAKARRIDRSAHRPALDETDKEAARTLLHKKKRAKKAEPFYRQSWFQAVKLGAILLAVAYVLYIAFFRPASADSLLDRADRMRVSDDLRERQRARDEPIKEFLERYPDDPRAEVVKRWRDEIDFALCERQMHNRRGKNMPIDPSYRDAEAEKNARLALDNEEEGNLALATRAWQAVLADKSRDPDDPRRAWALVAERYLADHKTAAAKYKELYEQAAKDKDKKPESKKETAKAPPETAMREALRSELSDASRAREVWEQLKKDLAADASQRPLFLIAAWRLRELNNKK